MTLLRICDSRRIRMRRLCLETPHNWPSAAVASKDQQHSSRCVSGQICHLATRRPANGNTGPSGWVTHASHWDGPAPRGRPIQKGVTDDEKICACKLHGSPPYRSRLTEEVRERGFLGPSFPHRPSTGSDPFKPN